MFRLTKLASVLGVTWSAIAAVAQAQTTATANNNGGPKPAVSAPQSPSASPQANALKPFSEIVKDAEAKPGFFTLWQKDDKVWLEILPEQLDQPFFFSVNRIAGIGEQRITGSTMLESHIGVLKKIGNSIQLLAQNNQFVPLEGSEIARAVRRGFSDSLLAAAPILSQPHPEKKSILIEMNALLLSDIPAGALELEGVYRQPYAFDGKNSSIERFAVTEDQATWTVRAHYGLAKLILPPLLAPGMPPPPQAPLPANLPDLRSLFLTYQYSFAKLPEPMRPRRADPRIGHFVTTHWDYSHDLTPTPRIHYVNRWRLEKKDPAVALSEPVQPIVFWLDDTIPLQYRDTVRDGVLEWNKAFERIGFKDAIVVRQKEKDTIEVMDARHASISWYLATDASSATGPRQVDPRTGEILDADIRIADVFTRGARRVMLEQRPGITSFWLNAYHQDDICDLPHAASAELDFALDLLAMRDGLEPDAPEIEREARKYLKEVVTHEVGHALGLRHNFRSSTIYSLTQLRDKAFTEKQGIAGSVMDYTPWNLNLEGESPGEYTMTGLGPYDYWAIEYAYKPLTPEVESNELAKIAERSSEPQLAFATDEDAGGFLGVEGMDPEVNRFDLGNDPLAYYQRRSQLSRELWSRLQKRVLHPGQDYSELRRVFDQGLRSMGVGAKLAAKYIGGVTHLRDFAGTGRAPLTPVSPDKQREALRLLTSQIFSIDNFRFSPEFMRRLTVNQLDRAMERLMTSLNEAINPDYSLSTRILALQKEVLDQVLADAVATRILDAETKVASADKAFQLSELYENLQNAVWSEAKQGKEVSAMRRNLQREHLKRLVALLTRPSGGTPADAKALARESAKTLLVDLSKAVKKPGLHKETRVHYADIANILEEALRASFQRAGL